MMVPVYREIVMIKDQLREICAELGRFRAMEAVRVCDLEIKQHPRYTDPKRLHPFAAKVNSQNGEDGMIQEIFRRIGTTDRRFLELGVGTGVENNTAFLLALGWSGYWVDGDGHFVSALNGDLRDALKYHVGYVTAENVEATLASLQVPDDLDLLSLDIDQNTYFVWEAMSRIRPRVVVVEYNAAIPPGIKWTVKYQPDRAWDDSNNFGASLSSLEELGRLKGYSLVGCDFHGVNAFFVREDLVLDQFCEPFSAENHHEPSRYFVHGTSETSYGRRGHAATLLDRQT